MKSVITNEIIDVIKNDTSEFPNIDIKPFEFLPVHAITVGLVRVVKHPAGSYLFLPDDTSGTYIAEWKQDVGELLYKDFKREQYSKYYELQTQSPEFKYKAMLRLADKDEMDDLKERGFLHLIIGDNSYTIIKVVPVDAGYVYREPNIYIADGKKQDEDAVEETYDKSYEEDVISVSLFE